MARFILVGSALLVFGCLSAKDSALFNGALDEQNAAGSASGGISAAQAGTDSRNGNAADVAGASLGGTSSAGSTSGSESAGPAGTAGKPIVEIPVIEDCATLQDATVSPLDGHCYRVNYQNLTFDQAREACHLAGGHLVTISSAAENAFVNELHDGEHWIGASDGRPDTLSGAGTYTWVTNEEWRYACWQEGQPNAYETNCPGQGDESDCFEHCAFQRGAGDWNDRSCWHTIVSVCEWDVEAELGAGGAAGAAAAAGAAGAAP